MEDAETPLSFNQKMDEMTESDGSIMNQANKVSSEHDCHLRYKFILCPN